MRPASDPGKPENPYRFVGKSGYYSDDETGLQLLRARYYDPLLGRFITQDPSRDGLNWYAYGGDNPVNAVDPTGTKPQALDKTMTSQVIYAMRYIKAYNAEAAKALVNMLNAGNIVFDPEQSSPGVTKGIFLGGPRVIIGSSYRSFLEGEKPMLNKRSNYSAYNEAAIDFAGTLFHEWVHTTPANKWDPVGCERSAYEWQFDFLTYLGNFYRFKGDGEGVKYANRALDTAWTDLQETAPLRYTYAFARHTLRRPQPVPVPPGKR